MAVKAAELRKDIAEEPVFERAEYERRVRVARDVMRERSIDVIVLFDPASVCYFTGFHSVNLWDLYAVVIADEDPVYVVLWDGEIPRFEVTGQLGKVVPYEGQSDPLDCLIEVLADLRFRAYGSDAWTRYYPAALPDRLARDLRPLTTCDARPVLWATRLRKSPAEIALLKRVAAVTDLGLAAVVENAGIGVSDHELAAAAAEAMLRAGSGHFSIQPIVAIGPRAGIQHSESSGRRIHSGDTILLELGACLARYTAPVMRTVVVGQPSERVKKLAAVASEAVEATVEALRPGTPCSDVARVTQRVITEGIPDIYFHGYSGYPVGEGFPPSWLVNLGFYIHLRNDKPLVEGMVFHLPISLRDNGERGVALSYTAVVGPNGGDVMTGTAAELIVK